MAAPVVVKSPKSLPIVDVLPSVKQGCDPLGVDLQGVHLIPEPLGQGRVSPFELGGCQLAHEQKHQLLLFAFGKRAGQGLFHLLPPVCSLLPCYSNL